MSNCSFCGWYGGGHSNECAKTRAHIAALELAVVAMAEDGWLMHGPEGMNEAQEKCYAAYVTIKPPNAQGQRAADRPSAAPQSSAATED